MKPNVEPRINVMLISATVLGLIGGTIIWYAYWVTVGIFVTEGWNALIWLATFVIVTAIVYFLFRQRAKIERARISRRNRTA